MPLSGPAAVRLFDDHVDAVYAYLARRLGDDLAPQAVSDTFERAIQSWDRFDPNDGSERSSNGRSTSWWWPTTRRTSA